MVTLACVFTTPVEQAPVEVVKVVVEYPTQPPSACEKAAPASVTEPTTAVATQAPAAANPTEANTASEPIISELKTNCGTWDTNPKTTNWLVPGASARGDVKAAGVIYYDNGVGEGTTIINNSTQPIEIYGEWGSGCETSVDVQFLVNKDLSVGCGDTTGDGVGDGCSVARVVVFEDGKEPTQTFYTEPQ